MYKKLGEYLRCPFKKNLYISLSTLKEDCSNYMYCDDECDFRLNETQKCQAEKITVYRKQSVKI
jgi:hypothetical protein